MTETDNLPEEQIPKTKTLKDLVNTPFKKAMFVVQLISYVLIVGSPAIGAVIGNVFDMDGIQTGGAIFAVFIVGEVLFYGSLFFLGKELLMLIKDKAKKWLKRNDHLQET